MDYNFKNSWKNRLNSIIFATSLPDGVTGNTSDSELEDSWFDSLLGNKAAF